MFVVRTWQLEGGYEETMVPILTGAEPFLHEGSAEIGVLLCHGFTGTPQSMRPWGQHLAAEGFTVHCPRLPGHGTHWRDLNRTRHDDWYGAIEHAFDELRGRCASTFVVGMSMGGTLALRLAQRRPRDLAGLAVVNPSVLTENKASVLLGALSHVVPSLPGIGSDIAKPGQIELAYNRLPLRAAASLRELWRIVRADLGKVRAPLAMYRSATDHIVEPTNARVVLDGLGCMDITDTVLPNSYHVATLDYDAMTIFNGSVEFVTRIHGARTGEPA